MCRSQMAKILGQYPNTSKTRPSSLPNSRISAEPDREDSGGGAQCERITEGYIVIEPWALSDSRQIPGSRWSPWLICGAEFDRVGFGCGHKLALCTLNRM